MHAIRYFSTRHQLQIERAVLVGDPWDVLGTMLGCVEIYPRQQRLFDRVLTKLIRVAHRAAFGIIKHGGIRSHVKLAGDLYLANVAVLEQQQAVEGTIPV
jgi:hypothetical protein